MCALRASIGVLAAALALCAGLASSGCASPSPRAEASGGAFVGNQGGAWEAVLPSHSGDPSAEQWLAVRNNESLSANGPASPLDYGLWPDPPAPSLDQVRQLFLVQRAESVPYFSAWGARWARPPHVYP